MHRQRLRRLKHAQRRASLQAIQKRRYQEIQHRIPIRLRVRRHHKNPLLRHREIRRIPKRNAPAKLHVRLCQSASRNQPEHTVIEQSSSSREQQHQLAKQMLLLERRVDCLQKRNQRSIPASQTRHHTGQV